MHSHYYDISWDTELSLIFFLFFHFFYMSKKKTLNRICSLYHKKFYQEKICKLIDSINFYWEFSFISSHPLTEGLSSLGTYFRREHMRALSLGHKRPNRTLLLEVQTPSPDNIFYTEFNVTFTFK
jgi:hypothetical protein